MQDLTILETARQLGYTKNAVKYQLAKLPKKDVYKDKNGVTRITSAGVEQLAQLMGNKKPGEQQKPFDQATTTQEPGKNDFCVGNNQATTTQEPGKNDFCVGNNQATTTQEMERAATQELIKTLQEQLTIKDKQLADANQQIKDLTTALLNEQTSAQQAQALHAGTIKQNLLEEPKRKRWWQKWRENQNKTMV